MQKLYYSISEVSDIVDEETHVLRYWEKEFDVIHPRKNRKGNRIYSPDDLETVKLIRDLIRGEKLTIKETKIRLAEILKDNKRPMADPVDNLFESSDEFEAESVREEEQKVNHTPQDNQPHLNPEIKNLLKEVLDVLKSID